MVITRWNSMGGINLLEWTVNPFQTSNVSKLQDFYGLSYEDLYNDWEMIIKWVKSDEIKYIKENRETEFVKKSTEWFELRDVQWDEKYQKLQQYYGFDLSDTQDTEKLVRLWMTQKDIMYITGKDIDKLTKAVDKIWDKTMTEMTEDKKWDEEIAKITHKEVNGEKVPNLPTDEISDDKKWDEEIIKQTEQGGDIDVLEMVDTADELREQHKKQFWKYPSKNIKLSTLKKKLWLQ